MTKHLRAAALLLAACLLMSAPALGAARPRLVVLISVDQFRADYLTRFEDLFLPPGAGGRPGGFRYLMERGLVFPDAHHDHLPLATGPGHSVLLTGAPPYKSGIVGNDWYDYARRASVYCVQDDASPIVGGEGRGVSARSLRVTTVGDELKMATGGQARVFGIALKDRAAVLMAGHLADGVFWYDDQTGGWVSSRYYRKDGTLPEWLGALNAERIPQSWFGKTWDFSAPASARRRLFTPTDRYADNPFGLGTAFPHVINGGLSAPGRASNRAFTYTPFANEYVLRSASRLVRAEGLGRREVPDLLAINLSSNDYIGHAYGPDSAEVLDATVRTDGYLARFFADLERAVPGGLASVTIVLTADHGAAPNAQALVDAGVPAGLWKGADAAEAAEGALDAALGADDWVQGYIEPYLWLNRETIARRGVAPERVQDLAAAAVAGLPGIYAAYTRHAVLTGSLPRTDVASHVTLGFDPLRSGDVVVISQPQHLERDTARGTSHGEPYAYDTHVPLLVAGFGIRPGVHTQRVSTLDIAPTLAYLLRVQQPSGCEGRILPGLR